jgi:hypothetical protein
MFGLIDVGLTRLNLLDMLRLGQLVVIGAFPIRRWSAFWLHMLDRLRVVREGLAGLGDLCLNMGRKVGKIVWHGFIVESPSFCGAMSVYS